MGREFLPPQDADCWGEFGARIEFERADPGSWRTPLRGVAAAALFVVALLSCGYAMQYRQPLLWLGALASLGTLGVLAGRAVKRADQRAARMIELGLLEDAWQDHLARTTANSHGTRAENP